MCCEEFENIGCFGSCLEEFDTKLIANVTGDWILEYEFDGLINKIKLEFTENDIIKIPNQFNEQYQYNAKLYDPNKSLFLNKCLTFKTIPEICK